MVKISQVDDREVFKICLEYWSKLVADLYEEMQALPVADLVGLNLGAGGMGGLSGGFGGIGVDNAAKLRKNIYYSDVLSNLRLVMVGKMVKPEEVGEPVCLGFKERRFNPRFPPTGLDRRERRRRNRPRVHEGERYHCTI